MLHFVFGARKGTVSPPPTRQGFYLSGRIVRLFLTFKQLDHANNTRSCLASLARGRFPG